MSMFILPRRPLAAACAAALTLGVAACADDAADTELLNTQWQVTRVSSGGSVSNVLSDTESGSYLADSQAGRVFVVFGDRNVRGASGCVDFAADVQWQKGRLQVGEVTTIPSPDVACRPNDHSTAQKIADVFSDGVFEWHRPSESSVRVVRADESAGGSTDGPAGASTDGNNPPFIELITTSS